MVKTALQPSLRLLIREARKSAEVSPIATPAISSKPRGKLARDEGAQKPIGKDSPVIRPNLEIVG
jgi:hypothetical protein